MRPVNPRAQTYRVTPAEDGQDLLDVLVARRSCSRRAAKRLLDERRVFVNGRRVWMAHHRMEADDRIEVQAGLDGSPGRGLRVLFRDARYVVVDKPPGLLSNGGADSVEGLLRIQTQEQGWVAAHRLDRDTSGCLLLARSPADFDRAVSWYRAGAVKKVYHAIVLGAFPARIREIAEPLDGQSAVTRVEVVASRAEASHLRLRILTGRTHQIRKHLLATGHPVAGDKAYGTSRELSPRLRRLPRQMLHAAEMELTGVDAGAVRARSPLPPDFMRALRDLGLR